MEAISISGLPALSCLRASFRSRSFRSRAAVNSPGSPAALPGHGASRRSSPARVAARRGSAPAAYYRERDVVERRRLADVTLELGCAESAVRADLARCRLGPDRTRSHDARWAV